MNLRGAVVLILEDEPIIGLALEDILVAEGALVLHTCRIDEARDLLVDRKVDTAILDVNVHGAFSYPVADLLAGLHIPFIFATGYGDRAHPSRFAAVPTIAKPYSAEDIRTALSQVA